MRRLPHRSARCARGLATEATPPVHPRQEGIGLVAAVGAGVTVVKEGDRVGVPWLYSACGHCEYCLAGWETVCASAEFGGYTKNGGFAEYILADPNYVAHIPAGLTATAVAPIICAGITTYKGIKVTGARPGQWLAVSGAGGLGHLAVQYGKAMGLNVCAIDIDDGKLAHAKRLGADATVNAKNGDPSAAVRKVTEGGAHGVVVTAPSLDAFRQGVGMTRKRGTCVLVGLPPGEFPLPCSTSSPTASPCGALSWGPARTWLKLWPSRKVAKSRRTSRSSPFHRSTTSSSACNTAMCPPESCSSSGRREVAPDRDAGAT